MPSKLDLVKKFIRVKYHKLPSFTYLILYVTSRCNLTCKHCFYWEELNKPETGFSLHEINKISSNMPKFEKLSLTGGEPFVRTDLPDIAECFVKNNDVQHITITTNGTLKKRVVAGIEEILARCPNTSLNIGISIDGLPETHDYIREREGGFQQTLQTYESLKKIKAKHPNLILSASLTANNYNQHELLRAYNMLKNELGFAIVDINYLRGDQKDPECKSPDIESYTELSQKLQNDLVSGNGESIIPMKIARVIEAAKYRYINKTARTNKYSIPCTAGLTSAVLYDNGDLFICEVLKKKLGNIRESEYDFSHLWLSSRADEVRTFIRESRCFCTHECYQGLNVLMSERYWPRIAWDWLRPSKKPASTLLRRKLTRDTLSNSSV